MDRLVRTHSRPIRIFRDRTAGYNPAQAHKTIAGDGDTETDYLTRLDRMTARMIETTTAGRLTFKDGKVIPTFRKASL